jgi:hypothetical protein
MGECGGHFWVPADARRAARGRPYWFSRRFQKPRSPWGMKITMAVKAIPSGIR